MNQNLSSPRQSPGGRALREQISLLADGQLQGDEFAQALDLVDSVPEAMAAWREFHAVGDALRSAELATGWNESGFVERLRARLAHEGMAPPSMSNDLQNASLFVAKNGPAPETVSGFEPSRQSANEARLSWRLVAGIAVLATVGAIGGRSFFGNDASSTPQLANQSTPGAVSPVVVSAVAQDARTPSAAIAGPQTPMVMIRDPHLDALMAAHKQFGGTTALQMPAGFLRNATFEGDNR